ncbi:hypothetical protein IAT38_004861 [Cryptococcus sp. DSM 104549]
MVSALPGGSSRGHILALALLLSISASVVSAEDNDGLVCAENPWEDPAHDKCNPLRYIPNKAGNMVAGELFIHVGALMVFWAWKRPARYFWCLVIGVICEGIGIFLRIALRDFPHNIGLFIVTQLLVVLAPCAFLAGVYILFGRLVAFLSAPQHLRPLTPRLVSRFFLWSDVITFNIQSSGSGLLGSHTETTRKIGSYVMLAGLAAQAVSFVLFTVLWVMFGWRVYHKDKALWRKAGWKPLYWAIGLSCICFNIRNVFRTVELGQGSAGYLATHEIYFFTLDSLPLFFGVSIYAIIWPGAWLYFPKGWTHLNPKGTGDGREDEEEGMEMPVVRGEPGNTTAERQE